MWLKERPINSILDLNIGSATYTLDKLFNLSEPISTSVKWG